MPFEMFNDGTSDDIEHWVSKMEQLIREYLADGDHRIRSSAWANMPYSRFVFISITELLLH